MHKPAAERAPSRQDYPKTRTTEKRSRKTGFGLWMAGLAWMALASMAYAVSFPLVASTNHGTSPEQTTVQVNGKAVKVWKCDETLGALQFKPSGSVSFAPGAVLYVKVAYVDEGYGKLNVLINTKDGKNTRSDRFLGMARSDTKGIATARMRLVRGQPGGTGGDEVAYVRVGLEHPQGNVLSIESVTLQDKPFEDPQFAYVISDPWRGPYTGPTVKPPDNTTLKGKVMVGYQGWFRTPNDPEGRGWVHWGDMQTGTFNTDMWPDVSQYPADVLEIAADVKTRSGKPGYLFSSAWPGAVNTQFRWMRENNIDGVFLQRFVSDGFNSIKGGPEWVLANTREAANREGRIWAVEYDVSGYPDAKLLETLKTDWMWFVDTFGVLKDPNYAREGGKPVVFIWGLPFPNRNISPATANAVVDFFKNDPKYGGNYVIGGIPGNWRKMEQPWQEHFKTYHCVLAWMSQSYAEDTADFKNLGLSYYAHVKPGFSWANLKHIATGDPGSYTPRDGGRYYWNMLSKAAKAGSDRLFVGMFDEYDESTAIMPMSDDAPPTPARPGIGATFYNGPRAQEQGPFKVLPSAELTFDGTSPCKGIDPQNFFVRMGGRIIFPAAGDYTFSLEGVTGDDVMLSINGAKIIDVKKLNGEALAKAPFSVPNRGSINYRLEYRHGTDNGNLRLFWQSASMPRQQVPPEALQDAWGRFLTNEGKPSNWWLKLTSMGKDMINGKLPADSPMPQ